MHWVSEVSTPLGEMRVVVSEEELLFLHFVEGEKGYNPRLCVKGSTPLTRQVSEELDAFFSGVEVYSRVPCSRASSPFQQKVWEAVRKIPRGSHASYGDMASAIGVPSAARAVGVALRANPFLLLIPCHRVIRRRGILALSDHSPPLCREVGDATSCSASQISSPEWRWLEGEDEKGGLGGYSGGIERKRWLFAYEKGICL